MFSMLGSIGSALIGAASNQKTNAVNREINQMNNEFNAREAEKAFQREAEYNDKIRAEDREYNSAKAQVERYREAGLNPTLMMQGQSAGMAQSNGVSSSAASAAPSAPQQSFTPNIDTSGISDSIMQFLEYKSNKELRDQQIEGLRIENKYKVQRILRELAESDSRELANKAKASLDQTLDSLQPMISASQRELNMAIASREREQKELLWTERLLKSKELATFDVRNRAAVARDLAQVEHYSALAGLTKQQKKTEIQKTLYTYYQRQGAKDAVSLARRTADAIVEKAIQETLPSVGRYGSNTGDWFGRRKYGLYPK